MRKSGEKPYLEGIASAPSTGPHSINGGSGNRAALQTAARPFLILLKKVRKGPKQSKSRRITSRRFLHGLSLLPWWGVSKAAAVPVLLQKWPPHSRWRSARRSGVGVPVCTGGRLFFGKRRYSSRAVFRFSFLFWVPRALFLGRFRVCGAPHVTVRLGKGIKNRKKGLTT